MGKIFLLHFFIIRGTKEFINNKYKFQKFNFNKNINKDMN